MNQRYCLRTDTRYLKPYAAPVDHAAADVTSFPVVPGQAGVQTEGCNLATVIPFAFMDDNSSAADKTFNFSIWGINSDTDKGYWFPVYIAKLKATIGTLTGVSGAPVTATQYFADTIELVDGDTSCRIISPANNNMASVTVDLAGAQSMYIGFSDVGTAPDKYNCLYGCI